MPAKVTAAPTGYEEGLRWAGGVEWLVHPEETMERASTALATDEGVYLVDPLDAPGVDDLLAEFGEVAGVVLLSNHHTRDAGLFARRHDVPVYVGADVPDGAVPDLAVPIERVAVGERLGDYEFIEVATGTALGAPWYEYALWNGETLRVGECVGTADYMRVGDEPLGVMTMRRRHPPTALRGLEPERVCSGHGRGLDENAAAALEAAIANAEDDFAKALLQNGLDQARTVLAALRSDLRD
ncbi:hypothetical protein [Haloglomus halophilum]|uniref:hypothetical protein n=1 Tax=Haloglomus halophilum TaxID=2962672 RepID=UPI0020CA0892|nr:hypothetical protein [Haloglomus halophilum]